MMQPNPHLDPLRAAIRESHLTGQEQVLDGLIARYGPSDELRARASARAADLVRAIRADEAPGLMEVFLAEYGLSTDEGIALMCLAEALLRVPDAPTIDALIEDKIAPSEWSKHLGQSHSPLVNASTWALMLTGTVLREGHGVAAVLKGAVKRVGEPVIRAAVGRAMKELGAQFVLGEDIFAAATRARAQEAKGFTYSYDMLGEAAMTAADAMTYLADYQAAIDAIAPSCTKVSVRRNPGISIKLSALFPRYETLQRSDVMAHLVPRVRGLAAAAAAADMGLNIDAEEADRLDLSLDVIEAVLRDPTLAGWDGFGVVVQAYGKRASAVIDWLYALAARLDRKIMVRLVKGAYWDTEIKRAQVEGLTDFPVYTKKAATDAAYLCCATQLMGMTDRLYPQFATHNAHSVASILEMGKPTDSFEFQRLHGMGASLHEVVKEQNGTACRIYAPVGAHRDLLAYLVRRLLENGANSSFVNQIVDENVPAEQVAADPFDRLGQDLKSITKPSNLFPGRVNARGWDLHDPGDLGAFEDARAAFQSAQWDAVPRVAHGYDALPPASVQNPANSADVPGTVAEATPACAASAIDAAVPWSASPQERRAVLLRAADLYEDAAGEIFALLAREAGKTAKDAIAELREAVDFLRFYAEEIISLKAPARGVIACISPWNFPLAIFTGQIAACLAAGNAVVAKPAETTPLIADLAARLLFQAGVPATALQLVPGAGKTVGAALCAHSKIAGVCFTGSTATAQHINRTMAASGPPGAPLVAETGGLNAMIVDSTALPEQAVRDLITGAFQSAGQRCSATRVLYLQEDIAEPFLEMLVGAARMLKTGDPWLPETDLGPVITPEAAAAINSHIDAARHEGRVIYRGTAAAGGSYVAPTILKIEGIEALKEEIFGPVLHVATYAAEDLNTVIEAINATGFGLTFGFHSRIDDRVEQVCAGIAAGNIYINRNQIGAVVGSQPFGGVGLSGTGPKAGGPNYVSRFTVEGAPPLPTQTGDVLSKAEVESALAALAPVSPHRSEVQLPGPTGESNRLSTQGRGTVLCLGPGPDAALQQQRAAQAAGCAALAISPGLKGRDGCLDGVLDADILQHLEGVEAVVFWGADTEARALRMALAARNGPILPLITEHALGPRCRTEQHICIDTTAAGGNAALLA